MATDPAHWLPGSFYRKPEWRLLRAEYLIATGRRRDRRIDDDWVAHARAALKGRGGSGSKAAMVRAARGVWDGDPAVKGELEARLLTDEPLDRVAARCRLPVAVVEAYAEVCFAVRPMRQATDWLLARAVGFSPLAGFTSPLPGAAWKLAALSGGPLVLDAVIAATAGRPVPEALLKEADPRRADGEARIRLLARLWVASMAATTDQEFARVVRDRRQFRDLDAHMTARVGAVAPTVTAMEAFLMRLPAANRKSGVADRVGDHARHGRRRTDGRSVWRMTSPPTSRQPDRPATPPAGPSGGRHLDARPASREPRGRPPDSGRLARGCGCKSSGVRWSGSAGQPPRDCRVRESNYWVRLGGRHRRHEELAARTLRSTGPQRFVQGGVTRQRFVWPDWLGLGS